MEQQPENKTVHDLTLKIAHLESVIVNLNARVDAFERVIGQAMYAAMRDMPDNHQLFTSFQERHAEVFSEGAANEQNKLTYEVISRIFSFVGRSLIDNGFMRSQSKN